MLVAAVIAAAAACAAAVGTAAADYANVEAAAVAAADAVDVAVAALAVVAGAVAEAAAAVGAVAFVFVEFVAAVVFVFELAGRGANTTADHFEVIDGTGRYHFAALVQALRCCLKTSSQTSWGQKLHFGSHHAVRLAAAFEQNAWRRFYRYAPVSLCLFAFENTVVPSPNHHDAFGR